MAYKERAKLIEEIESLRGSLLLTYITSTRQGLQSSMSMDIISKAYKLLQKIDKPKKDTKIDLFIHSYGGEGVVPWKLVSLIREYCDEFNVIVPYKAFSAATLTALGADNIYMHPMGMLGPTDPSVGNDFNPVNELNPLQRLGINVEDVYSYIDLVKEDVGITHEDELIKAWEYMAGKDRVHPLALGNVKRSHSQSRMMAKKLLGLHMDQEKSAHTIDKIVDNLNSKLFFHGHPINRSEAAELDLKIKDMSEDLEKAVWKLYQDYEDEMKLEEPFVPEHLLKAKTADYPVIYIVTNQIQGLATAAPSESPAQIDVEEIVTCTESNSNSYTLRAGFRIEGYRILNNNGLIEQTNLFPTTLNWKKLNNK